MTASTVTLLVQAILAPSLLLTIGYFLKERRKLRAESAKIVADTALVEADSRVKQGSVHAAIELADVGTLQAHVTAMSAAFKEERESLTRRLDEADQKMMSAAEALERAHEVIDDLRQDQRLTHREMLDLQRRDQHHAQMLAAVSAWMTELARTNPGIAPPPMITQLAPLLITEGTPDPGRPHRRWNDPAPEPEETQP